MKLSDLQFENGQLVKISGMRPEYCDGHTMTRQIRQLAVIADQLRHQLEEVTGTVEEYEQMPCKSLQIRMFGASERAARKLKELK